MAAIVRRNWPAIRDEAISAGGGHNHTGWSSRVEQFTYSAWLRLCLTYHFHELETSTTFTPVDGDLTLTLPADCFIVHSLAYGTAPIYQGVGKSRQLTESAGTSLFGMRSSTKGIWTSYVRFGLLLHMNCPLDVNQSTPSLPLTLHYYKRPAAVDFADSSAGNVPLTSWEWDEPIIDAAVARIQGRTWNWGEQGMTMQTLQDWLSSQIQPDLQSSPMSNPPDIPTASRPPGGPQG